MHHRFSRLLSRLVLLLAFAGCAASASAQSVLPGTAVPTAAAAPGVLPAGQGAAAPAPLPAMASVRNAGTVRNTNYYALADAGEVRIGNGDDVNFIADKKPGTITVRVEGEHQGQQEYVLPYGARVGSLLRLVRFSERSDTDSIQLFRQSVRVRQKEMLQISMNSLESTVLTARNGTSDEARLRKEKAELILQWVERAKKIEPRGQVLIATAAGRDDLLLENGDIIRVPSRDGLVLVSGEVLFPNAIAYDGKLELADYISRAGGYTQNARSSGWWRTPTAALRMPSQATPARGRRSAGVAEGGHQVAAGLQGHDANYLPDRDRGKRGAAPVTSRVKQLTS